MDRRACSRKKPTRRAIRRHTGPTSNTADYPGVRHHQWRERRLRAPAGDSMREWNVSMWRRATTSLTAVVLLAFAAAVVMLPERRASAQSPGPEIAHFTLKNGLEVVVIPDRRVPVVTHMVWYR